MYLRVKKSAEAGKAEGIAASSLEVFYIHHFFLFDKSDVSENRMPNSEEQNNILNLNANSEPLKELKKAKLSEREEDIKFNAALADYLVHLFLEAKKNPSLAAEAGRFFPKEKMAIIDRFIEDMRTDIDNYLKERKGLSFYILSPDRLENAPSLLIRLLEYLCFIHQSIMPLNEDNCFRYFKRAKSGSRRPARPAR